MALQIITLAIAILAAIGGVWKWIARMKSERRRLADEAKKKLDQAHNGGDESDLLDAWDDINRVR